MALLVLSYHLMLRRDQRERRERWHVSLLIPISRVAPDWDLWRPLYQLSYSAAAASQSLWSCSRSSPPATSAAWRSSGRSWRRRGRTTPTFRSWPAPRPRHRLFTVTWTFPILICIFPGLFMVRGVNSNLCTLDISRKLSASLVPATTSEAPSLTTTATATATATTEPTRIQTTLQPTTVELEQMTTNTIAPIDSELKLNICLPHLDVGCDDTNKCF